MTSAIVKAYPPINVTESTINFILSTANSTNSWGNFSGWGNLTGNWNFTVPSNFSLPPSNFSIPSNFTRNTPVTIKDADTFWSGVNEYQYFGKAICEAGGTAYSYITSRGAGGFSFSTTIEIPAMTKQEVFDFVQPLIDSLNDLGIPVNNSQPVSSASWGDTRKGQGDSPGSNRFASRLFPAANWEDETAFADTMAAIRRTVEAGYTFHGIHMMPTEETAGYPGDSAVNPAFRATVMHADVFDVAGGPRASVQALVEAHDRLNEYMDGIRAATPLGGAYINECDAQEPNWQQSFFGDKYDALLKIKRETDPWNLFWAPTTVGSEDWEVRTADGLPTQNGQLCRVKASAA